MDRANMIQRLGQFNMRNIGICRRNMSRVAHDPAAEEDLKPWVPAPKGIAACKLHKNSNEEMGQFNFEFNGASFQKALEKSRATDKPVLLIFQEMLGSPESIAFGKTVLSQPLLIEAAESLFITVIVNIAGTTHGDAQILYRYQDNCHYDTVVRIVNEKGQDLVGKLEDSRCSVGNIAKAMVEVLERKELKIPNYLRVLEREYIARVEVPSHVLRAKAKNLVFGTEDATKAEIAFTELNGVIGVECGKLSGCNVVKVTYNADVVSCRTVFLHAVFHVEVEMVYWTDTEQKMSLQPELQKLEVAQSLYEFDSSRLVPGRNPKQFLRTTLFRYVPLTTLQSMLANLAISKNLPEDANNVLSPRQLAILEAVEIKSPRKETVDVAIAEAWNRLERDGVYDWN